MGKHLQDHKTAKLWSLKRTAILPRLESPIRTSANLMQRMPPQWVLKKDDRPVVTSHQRMLPSRSPITFCEAWKLQFQGDQSNYSATSISLHKTLLPGLTFITKKICNLSICCIFGRNRKEPIMMLAKAQEAIAIQHT